MRLCTPMGMGTLTKLNSASGRPLHSYGKSPSLIGKSTVQWAIFNSYAQIPESKWIFVESSSPWRLIFIIIFRRGRPWQRHLFAARSSIVFLFLTTFGFLRNRPRWVATNSALNEHERTKRWLFEGTGTFCTCGAAMVKWSVTTGMEVS